MSNLLQVKTNFTAGCIGRNLYGRGDLSIFENGARTLENVIIHPTGGVSRRRGLAYIDRIDRKARLIPFEFNTEQTYLICISADEVRVYRDGACIKTLPSPWREEHLNSLNYTQSADTLLVVHPDVSPRQITRGDNEDWKIGEWEYYTKDGRVFCPFYNYYNHKAKISPGGTGGTITVTSSSKVFVPASVGSLINVRGGQIKISEYVSASEVKAVVNKGLSSTGETVDWEESAFSPQRGWPNSVTFHQNRLVVGGSKSLPNRLWFSKSADLFNFDIGTGLDDEAIEFGILSDQVNVIKAVVSARHLLVFMTGAEWMVSGNPLTPTSIQLSRQTSTGSYAPCSIYPQQIDGATVFVSQSGHQLREFLYTDTEQAYQSKDLTLMSGDIVNCPVDNDFSRDECVLYIVLADGTVSCLTTYRTEEVTAWSRLKTAGSFQSVAVIGNEIYFCVKRGEAYFIEKMSNGFYADCAVRLSSETPKKEWSGLDNLEGYEVSVLADGFSVGKYTVFNGRITLLEEASELEVGLPYEHVIEPLPYVADAVRPYSPQALRVISGLFRILDTRCFCIDMGGGYLQVPLKRLFKDKILDAPPSAYSGDVKLRALGWIREMDAPLWSVKSDEPLAFTLLSVVLEVKIKG